MFLGLTFQCTKLHSIVLHMLILPVSSLAQSYPYVWSSLAGRHGHDIHCKMKLKALKSKIVSLNIYAKYSDNSRLQQTPMHLENFNYLKPRFWDKV